MELLPQSIFAVPPLSTFRGALAGVEAVDAVLDLSKPGRNVFSALRSLSPDEREQFLSMTADLLKQGIVGTETLEVRGQPYTSFVTTRIAAPHLRGARTWRTPTGIDLRG